MKHPILSGLLLFLVALDAQGQLSKRDQANLLSTRYRFAEAYTVWSEIAQESIASGTPDWDAARMAVSAAIKAEKYSAAQEWSFKIARSSEATTNDVTTVCSLAMRSGAYDEARALLDSSLRANPQNQVLQNWSQRLKSINQLLEDSVRYTVSRLRPQSLGDEFGAVPYERGIVFVSNSIHPSVFETNDAWTLQHYFHLAFIPDTSKPEPQIDIWDELLGKRLWPGLKRSFTHDGPISFSKDGKWAVVTRNNNARDIQGQVRIAHLNLDFYERVGTKWIERDVFTFNDARWNTAHGSFAKDGSLIFSSDRPGGFGGMDLYRCAWNGSGFNLPENLGPLVNTSNQEVFPSVSASGNVYFSSDGHPGVGGLDVFVWDSLEVKRMGRPISSSGDDFSFHIDEATNRGFLSSNRGGANDAIFAIERLEEETVELIVSVVDCSGLKVANAAIELTDNVRNTTTQYTTDNSGQLTLRVTPKKPYSLGYSFNGVYDDGKTDVFTLIKDDRIEIVVKRQQEEWIVRTLDKNGQPLSNVALTFVQSNGIDVRATTDESGTYTWMPASDATFSSVIADQINRTRAQSKLPLPNFSCPEVGKTFSLVLEELSDQESINLGMILYDLNLASLRTEGKQELDKLVKYMLLRPELRVELSSHTDSRASEKYNQELSQRRAQSCIDYIVNQGISPQRIIAKGYGESRLINGCGDQVRCSEAEHQANRRTELRLIE